MLFDDGTVSEANESKVGSDGVVKIRGSNTVGRNDEQYPALFERSGDARYSICVIERSLDCPASCIKEKRKIINNKNYELRLSFFASPSLYLLEKGIE